MTLFGIKENQKLWQQIEMDKTNHMDS